MLFIESVLWLDALYAQFYFILIKTLLGKNYYYADFIEKKQKTKTWALERLSHFTKVI